MSSFEKAMQQARDALRQALADPGDYRADLAARTFAHDARRALTPPPRAQVTGLIVRTRRAA